ncbi:MAG: hypothetical protein R3E65_02730 [Steroidobacteraceae bacterium]
MSRCRDHHIVPRAEALYVDRVLHLPDRFRRQDDIQVATQQALEQCVPVTRTHGQQHARVLAMQVRKRRGNDVAQQRRGRAHCEAAGACAAHRIVLAVEVLEFGRDRAGMRQQQFADGSQPHGAPVTFEQRAADAFFELCDALADGLLRQVDALAGQPKAAQISECEKMLQLA